MSTTSAAITERTPRVPVVVAGGINLDLVVRVPRLPLAGETIHGRDLARIPGGKGANQAAAVARLGGIARLLGQVGDDDAGRALLQSLDDDRVDRRWLRVIAHTPSGVALIAVADDGANTIIVAPGANARADAATVEAATGAFAEVRVVMGQLEWPYAAVQALLARAPRGATRILNAAPADRRALDLLPAVDWLVVNEVEAALLSGRPVTDCPTAVEAGRALRGLGVGHVAVTLGAEGAVLVGPSGALLQPTLPVEVVDTTAAGDAFAGALAVALAEGRPDDVALRFAVVAGSLACTVLGARPSLPERAAVVHALTRTPAGKRL